MKAELNHLRNILVNTISLLCKNSISFQDGMRIHGLLGITVDEEVFLVEISEQFSQSDNKLDADLVLQTDKTGQENHSIVESFDTVAKHKSKDRQKKHPRASTQNLENLSDTNAECSTDLNPELPGDQKLYSNFKAASDSDVIYVKAENGADDVLMDLLADGSTLSMQPCGLPQSSTKATNCVVAVNSVDLLLKPENESNDVEILDDNAANGEALSDADSYSDLYSSRCWLGSSENNVSARSSSQMNFSKRKHQSHKYSFSAESRSLLGEAVLVSQRRSATTGTWPQSARRSALSVHKQFKCDIEGCTRSYYAKKNLLRHQTSVHGRVPNYRRPNFQTSFCQEMGY